MDLIISFSKLENVTMYVMKYWHKWLKSNVIGGEMKMIKRTLYCSVCGREVKDDEEIYAKMKAPENVAMVEIKAYLKKKSEIICIDCYEK